MSSSFGAVDSYFDSDLDDSDLILAAAAAEAAQTTKIDTNTQAQVAVAVQPDETSVPMTIPHPGQPDSSNPLYERAVAALKKHWGHSSFRTGQFDLIASIAGDKRDCFALMSTGAGKSVCFQLLPLLTGRPVMVISPLIALMQDQVRSLKERGIKACALTSAESDPRVTTDAMAGAYQLIYMSPERLSISHAHIQSLEHSIGLTAFAIDESHCISGWGHDFRSDYRTLGNIRRLFPRVPIMALTATATPAVFHDVCMQLQLNNPFVLKTTYNRPNLYFEVRMSTSIQKDFTRQLVGDNKVSCIVYVPTKIETEKIAAHLQSLRINAHAYHAGLSNDVRSMVHTGFMHDKIRVVVATVAFGMGIDHGEIRKVINYGLVKNLESLVQMTGRAGRDGQPAECIMMYAAGDYTKAQFLTRPTRGGKAALPAEMTHEERHKYSVAMAGLDKVQEYVSSNRCRRIALLAHFGEDWRHSARPPSQSVKGELNVDGQCGNCDNCLAAKYEQVSDPLLGGDAPVSFADIDASHLYYFALAVSETNERFGLSWVQQFLKGSASKKITDRESWFRVRPLSQCQSHGKLKSESPTYLHSLGRYLVNLNILAWHQSGDFTILKLGSAGRQIIALGIKGLAAFKPSGPTTLTPELRSELETRRARRTRPGGDDFAAKFAQRAASIAAAASRLAPTVDPLHAELLDLLIDLRVSIARERGIPPYIIFSTSELESFSRHRPTTFDRMAQFGGVSQIKWTQFGERFAQAIQKFAKEKKVQTDLDIHTKPTTIATPTVSQPASSSSVSHLPSLSSSIPLLSSTRSTYLDFLTHHHLSDHILSAPCTWHPFPSGLPITRIHVSGTHGYEFHEPKGKCQGVWSEWMNGARNVNAMATERGVQSSTIGSFLAGVLLDGAPYEWESFNIPDAAVDEIQSAILAYQSDRSQPQHQVQDDKKCVGLWEVPFFRSILAKVKDPSSFPYGFLNIIVAHIRRIHGPSGPETKVIQIAPCTPATNATMSKEDIIQIDDDNHGDDMPKLEKMVTPPPVALPSPPPTAPTVPLQSDAAHRWSSSSASPPASRSLSLSASPPLPLARSSSLPVAAAAAAHSPPPATSSLVQPVYHLESSDVHPSRAITKQKIRVLELFHANKTISDISQQFTLRASTVVQILCDLMVHGYALDPARFGVDPADASRIAAAASNLLPPDAFTMPMAALIPTIVTIKAQMPEECSKEKILLVIHKHMHDQHRRVVDHTHAKIESPVLIDATPSDATLTAMDVSNESYPMTVDDIVAESMKKSPPVQPTVPLQTIHAPPSHAIPPLSTSQIDRVHTRPTNTGPPISTPTRIMQLGNDDLNSSAANTTNASERDTNTKVTVSNAALTPAASTPTRAMPSTPLYTPSPSASVAALSFTSKRPSTDSLFSSSASKKARLGHPLPSPARSSPASVGSSPSHSHSPVIRPPVAPVASSHTRLTRVEQLAAIAKATKGSAIKAAFTIKRPTTTTSVRMNQVDTTPPPSPPVGSDSGDGDGDGVPDDESYEVERILSSRTDSSSRIEYLVKWSGYPLADATWEGKENLDGARDAITEFEQKRR